MLDDKHIVVWNIRDVPEATRRLVKAYAAEYGLTIPEALTELVTYAVDASKEIKAKQ